MNNPCQLLDWDSNFFGRRIARVTAHELSPALVDEIQRWCAAHAIDCLYFLAVSDHHETTRLAETHDFHLMDIRLTLDRSLKNAAFAPPDSVRPYRPDDLPALKAIAHTTYAGTRFFYDPNFSAEQCARMYELWIENSCNAGADAVFVAEVDRRPVGYVTCVRNPDDSGQIGLLGVSNAHQGQGTGSKLIQASLGWFKARGFEYVKVVTQGRNVGAQRSYQRHGFLTKTVQLWYHRWFSRPTQQQVTSNEG